MPAQPPAESPFAAFAACPAKLLVIGGNALIAYGSDRLTQDCDCAVVSETEKELASELVKQGYVFQEQQDSFTRYVHLGRLKPVVDVMLLNKETFEKLWLESREVLLGGVRLRVPKPLHLVALKLHALKQNPDRMGKDWEASICLRPRAAVGPMQKSPSLRRVTLRRTFASTSYEVVTYESRFIRP